jgi:riboflavin biosynthesis pyrimidine reductase
VTGRLQPLQRLFEVESLPRTPLPEGLARLYDGDLGFAEQSVYANFVSTVDGAVAIPAMPGSNDFIAGNSDADRFVMGLLRAFADVVIIGSGVLRASPRGTWRPEGIFPPAGEDYAELRKQVGASGAPEVAVLTGSGSIDVDHPLLETGALVLTTALGAGRLAGRMPSTTTVIALERGPVVPPGLVVVALRARGHARILCEAGPHTFGSFLQADAVDELFVTRSPLVVGNAGPRSRLALVEGADLSDGETRVRLLSVRRHGSHLFQRYAFEHTRRS